MRSLITLMVLVVSILVILISGMAASDRIDYLSKSLEQSRQTKALLEDILKANSRTIEANSRTIAYQKESIDYLKRSLATQHKIIAIYKQLAKTCESR